MSQGSKRKPASEGHSHTVKCREREQFRTAKGSQTARGTDSLPEGEEGIYQNSELERKPVRERHLHPISPRGRDKSSQGQKASEQVALTSCQAQREQKVRTVKESCK